MAALLAGCANAPTPAVQPSAPSVSPSAPVTYDEYQAAFSRYSSCLESAGFSLLIHGEENQTIDYSVPGAAVEAGDDKRCYDAEFSAIDQAWQIQQLDTSESAAHLRDCLAEQGIVPAETYTEMLDQLTEAGLNPSVCDG